MSTGSTPIGSATASAPPINGAGSANATRSAATNPEMLWRGCRYPASHRRFAVVTASGAPTNRYSQPSSSQGYLWSAQVAGDTDIAPHPNCNTINWINVSDWAIGRIGLTQWRSTQLDGPMPWSSGENPNNYWSAWCLGFASNAWQVAGGGIAGRGNR